MTDLIIPLVIMFVGIGFCFYYVLRWWIKELKQDKEFKEELEYLLGQYQNEIRYGNFDNTIKEIRKLMKKHMYLKCEIMDGYWAPWLTI